MIVCDFKSYTESFLVFVGALLVHLFTCCIGFHMFEVLVVDCNCSLKQGLYWCENDDYLHHIKAYYTNCSSTVECKTGLA